MAKLVTDAPIPKVRPDYVIVKNVAVALNPADWKHIDFMAQKGAIVGCDYAGIVDKVGPNVSHLKKGDRVAGFVHGCNLSNTEDGAYAEYIAAKAALCIKVPDNLSMEQASTLGVGITSVGQALYQSLELPWPTTPAETPFPVLIYGGSTATGSLAIQFAKLSGLTVVTTCSPHNFDMVKSLGADHVFDYKSPTVGDDIWKLCDNKLQHAFDCFALDSSAAICSKAMSSKGGKYSSLLIMPEFPRPDITNVSTLAYTAIGETFTKGTKKHEGNPADLEFATKFWKLAGDYLAEGKVKTHPIDVREGGLEGILGGLRDMKKGLSGKKLVYPLDEPEEESDIDIY
jgi:NADPH:quinone reductase-like Zn-dependent oxidoreductase